MGGGRRAGVEWEWRMKASTGHNGSLADALIAARRRCVRGCVGAWVRGCLRVRVRVCATCGEHTPVHLQLC